MAILCRPVAASVRRSILFPPPHSLHPIACKRRQDIKHQSPIRLSASAATVNPQSSAAFSS